jgi:predicted AlkP superfamily pyrophosphatase or phosphodiesterase
LTYTPSRPLFARARSLSRHRAWLLVGVLGGACATQPAPEPATPTTPVEPQAPATAAREPAQPRVIVLVWDGLRPDSIDPQVTPRLAALRDKLGVDFREHHSVFPTFTMMNAAALATGVHSGTHGFYGNTLYQPGPTGSNSKGLPVDFAQPVYAEDYKILQSLDAFYRTQGKALLHVQTLFEAAHAKGLKTAALGKGGAAFLQDYRGHGLILDDDMVWPRSFGSELQSAGFALPARIKNQAFAEGPLPLAENNGDPTAATHDQIITLEDGTTIDPRAQKGSPHNSRNAYMMKVLTEYVLPKVDPALTLIWLRNPDSTQHQYGPGTPNAIDALRHQDELLGQLQATLQSLGRASSTDILIVSDHGHSTVAADPKRFPTRALIGEADGHGKVGEPAEPGYVVSGEVRSVDWLRRAGFPHTYDGNDCAFDPVLSGIKADGKPLYPTRKDLSCSPEKPNANTPSYRLPAQLPKDAIVIAANGGSEYFYLPSQDQALLKRLTTALQEREAYGPIFVRSVHGAVPGTFPLTDIGLEGPGSVSPPTPDLVVSFAWDADATSAAGPSAPGTELASAYGNRGMHGSFSPRDVHNTLIAAGPHFRAGVPDVYPTSNLDVAPTLASLLNLELPQAAGRVLLEALSDARERFDVQPFEQVTEPVALKRTCTQDDLECKRPQPAASYRLYLRGRVLTWADGKRSQRYFDQAEARREKK